MSKDIFEEVAFEDLPLEEGPSSKPTIFDPFGHIAIRLNNNLGAIVIFFLRAFVMIFRMTASAANSSNSTAYCLRKTTWGSC